MKHQKYEAAYKTLLAIRGEPILAAKEILYVHYQMDVEMRSLGQIPADLETNGNSNGAGQGQSRRLPLRRVFHSRRGRSINYWQKLGQLFREKRIRRAMIAATVCMVSQQLCGVNVSA